MAVSNYTVMITAIWKNPETSERIKDQRPIFLKAKCKNSAAIHSKTKYIKEMVAVPQFQDLDFISFERVLVTE